MASLPVYNCSTATIRQLSFEGIVTSAEVISRDTPLDKMIWIPGGSITNYRVINFLKTLLLHVFPALILDCLLKFTGKKAL